MGLAETTDIDPALLGPRYSIPKEDLRAVFTRYGDECDEDSANEIEYALSRADKKNSATVRLHNWPIIALLEFAEDCGPLPEQEIFDRLAKAVDWHD